MPEQAMKIAVVAGETLPVPPVLGGAIEQMVYDMVNSLKGPEWVVLSPWSGALKNCEISLSKRFYHVDVLSQLARLKPLLEGIEGFQDLLELNRFCYVNGVTDLLYDLDPDVIQVENRPQFVPYLSRQFPDKHLVLDVHNEEYSADPCVREATERCDQLVVVSRFLADGFIAQYPECADKITVIYNGVDTQVWCPELKVHHKTRALSQRYGLCGHQTVLFVGRTVREKGVHCLLDAMDLVLRFVPDAKLLVVGSPLFGAVREDVFYRRLKKRALDMGDAVVFTGYVDHIDLPYYYAAADMVIVPTLVQEAFGKVVIEAMASGIPVIASRRGGIPEVVDDGMDGILLDDPEDVGMLAYRIVEMLEDNAMRSEMGEAGRQKVVEKFSQMGRFKRLRTFYQNVEAKRK